jgi:tetratricopeptide (TPR) repeat protein
MRRWLAIAVVGVGAASGCAPKAVSIQPAGPTPQVRLARADALVNAGCLDCLIDALADYDALAALPGAAEAAAVGASRTAMLIALRERELGLESSGAFARARELVEHSPAAGAALGSLLDIADAVPRRVGTSNTGSNNDAELARMQAGYRNREAWLATARAHANEDPASAYVWTAFNCFYSTSTPAAIAEWLDAAPAWRGTPLVMFRASICGGYDGERLARLLADNPRFVEVNYFLGLRATLGGRLEEAAEFLQRAFAWRPRWPAVTYAIAGVYLTAEEFASALEFYDRTLALEPSAPDPLLGRLRALTYLGRHDEALRAADELLALGHWYIGDARYWRALNETQLARYDEAWADIELAAKLVTNAEVPKLAGIIAYRRQHLDVSRAKFEESRLRSPSDCEVGFYLQIVLAEQAQWSHTADVAPATAVCFDQQEVELRRQITEIRAKTMAADRQARQIAKREQTIAANARMRAACWFNATVASFNLKKPDDARRFGEKVADDEQFGERTRDLLSRLGRQ